MDGIRDSKKVAAGDFAVGSTKLTVQLRTWEHSTPALGIDICQVLDTRLPGGDTNCTVGCFWCLRVCMCVCVCVLYKLLDFFWSCRYWNDNTSDEAANSSKEGKSIGTIEQVRELLSCSSISLFPFSNKITAELRH